MSADAQIVKDEMDRLYDIAKRIEAFDMDENVRKGIALSIYDSINTLCKHFELNYNS